MAGKDDFEPDEKDRRKFEKALNQLLGRKDLVDFIDQFCDRWCDKCPATHRCRNYLLGRALGHETSDREPRKFWESLAASARPVEERPKKRRKRDGDSDPIVRMAHDYTFVVFGFFDEHAATLAAFGKTLATSSRAAAMELQDAIETIMWYHTLCSAKILRGLSIDNDEFFGDDEDDAFSDKADLPKEDDKPYDPKNELDLPMPEFDDDEDVDEEAIEEELERDERNGSTKIALIGLDRSLDAWAVVRRLAPAFADHATSFSGEITRLRKELETRVPGARTFVRPGLDDATLDRPKPKRK